MSTAALATSASLPLPSTTSAPIASRWPLIAAALVIASAFFISEHNVRVSLAEAYTQSADEMQITAEGGNSLRRIMFLGVATFGLLLLATGENRLQIDPVLALAIGALLAWTSISFL